MQLYEAFHVIDHSDAAQLDFVIPGESLHHHPVATSTDDPLVRSGTAGNTAIRYLTEAARQRGENT